MNVTMHMPSFKIIGLTAALQETVTGPVDEVSMHGAGPDAPFLVFRCLEDYDQWIGFLLARKAVFGEAQARHAARPLMPPPQRDAEPAWAAPVIELSPGAVIDVPRPAPDTSGDGPGDLRELPLYGPGTAWGRRL